MTNLIGIYNHATGEQTVREMSDDELAKREIEIAEWVAEKAQKQKEAQDLRKAKISAYEKLGLTPAEIEALLPTTAEPISQAQSSEIVPQFVADSSEATGLKWAAPAGASITFDNAEVTTNQSTTSTSFTDLTTSGPAVTLTTSTKALVIISAYCKIDTADRGAYASFAISGATTKSAATVSGDTLSIAGPEDAFNTTVSASAACVVTLTAGSNTFTMKYAKGGPSGSASFSSRAIFVMRLN